MRTARLLTAVLLVGVALTLGLALLRVLSAPAAARPQPVPRGDQEIAWIHAATNSATWERFVAGVRQVRDARPDLVIDTDQAFPEQSTRVPEVTLAFPGSASRLRIRWYKLTSEMGIPQWVRALAERDPSPLAIIGGGSSDRARDLARALQQQQAWHGAPPLLLITTATADKVTLEDDPGTPAAPAGLDQPKLIDLYPGRTFRFCFQNSQMAEAVVDFVWGRPDLRPHADPGQPNWPAPVFTASWEDDPYSIDLADRFQEELHKPERGRNQVTQYSIPYSVGDYNEPNLHENELVVKLAQDIAHSPRPRRLLVLPTLVKPARRVVRRLAVSAPAAVRNVVAVTGDSISFNNIYRDRDVAWNVQEMPVTLVFFCHQDPVHGPEFDPARADLARLRRSATDDVRLNADMMEILLKACPPSAGTGGADALAENLRGLKPPFFAPDGNRLGGGEYVVCLRPQLKGEEVLPAATVEVWRRDRQPVDGTRWRLYRSFPIRYDVLLEGGHRDAGP